MPYRNWAPVLHMIKNLLVETTYSVVTPYGFVLMQFAGVAIEKFLAALAEEPLDGCVANTSHTLVGIDYDFALKDPHENGFYQFLNEACNTTFDTENGNPVTNTPYFPITPQYHFPYTLAYMLPPAIAIIVYDLFLKDFEKRSRIGDKLIPLNNSMYLFKLNQLLKTLEQCQKIETDRGMKDATLDVLIVELSTLRRRLNLISPHITLAMFAPLMIIISTAVYVQMYAQTHSIPSNGYLGYLATQFCNNMLATTGLSDGGTLLVAERGYEDARSQFINYDSNCTDMLNYGYPNYPSEYLRDYTPPGGVDFGTVLIQSWMSLLWVNLLAYAILILFNAAIKIAPFLSRVCCSIEEPPTNGSVQGLLYTALNESDHKDLRSCLNRSSQFCKIEENEVICTDEQGSSYITTQDLAENIGPQQNHANTHRTNAPLTDFFKLISPYTSKDAGIPDEVTPLLSSAGIANGLINGSNP